MSDSDANSDAGSNDSSIYFVERILRQKYKKGKRYFLIRWIGYDESEDTWEPEENVNPIMVAYYDNNKEDGNGSDTQYTPKSKKRKVTRKNRGKKKKKNAKKVKAAPKQSEKQHPVVENNQDQEIERNEDPGAEPINDPTNTPKEEPIKEYVDPVDAYKDDQIDKYIEVTTNSSPLEHVSFGDSESSSSEDYQEASLSQAVTEKVQEVSSPHLQIQSTPKRRIELIKGYASIQFEDKKLRMLVKYQGENKFQFVLHEELRRDYPQELIDYYERSTDWSGENCFYS